MKIKDVLLRDPATHPLVNAGQARIADREDARVMQELRGELATFVCEGQYADGIQRIVRSFLDNLGRTNQRGAWVSGFFGSGKSHLLKMLCHLWRDTEFDDGATARSLVPAMPGELTTLLRELDVAGRRAGGLLAAAGSLPAGTTDHVRRTVLGVLLRAAGLPEQYPLARFCLWLHEQGRFDTVKAAVEAEDRSFERELNNLYVSGPIARALVACDPAFADGEAEARKTVRAQFPPPDSDITTEQFLRAARDALAHVSGRDRIPCTLVVLDEVQQYVGDSNDRSTLVTEVAEAVEKQLDSRVMIVGAGQSALTDVSLLQKLMDRFTIRVPLSDTDVETVTRKVLLSKKPTAVAGVRSLLDAHDGEISRQLQGTRIGTRDEDRAILIDDYPLLPVRRRFWDECFRRIDAAGTSSQLRSQLRIVHDAVGSLSDRPLGAVISGAELFDALAPEMVSTGVLLREINERIVAVGKSHGALARRVCGLAFLIGRLAEKGGADPGVRATKAHIADLLVDDLAADNGKLRDAVGAALDTLADDGTLMRTGDEYRLQTRQGSEWDRAFRNRQTRLNNDAAAIQFERDRLLGAAIDTAVGGLRMVQGAAREPRRFAVHRGETPPTADGLTIPVWIRDGWSSSRRDVEEAARLAGADSPVVHVFVPRRSADDLRRRIVEAEAARQTLDEQGDPTGTEGQEARRSMESRRALAEGARDRLIEDIASNARVFQGGGNESVLPSLKERVEAAGDAALARLFPRFREADSGAWPAAIKRARDGADLPLQPTGYDDATERHPVCREVVVAIGAGAAGATVRKTLADPPFGWPRDAVDAALMALHRMRHITATLNGAAVAPGALAQSGIPRTEFRVERTTLSVRDRLTLRRLFQALDVSCRSGEEDSRAGDFLNALAALARFAGGDPPLPAPPATVEIEDAGRLAGNDRLAAIRDKADAWKENIELWKAVKALIESRLPSWRLVERLAAQAASVEGAGSLLEEVEAVRAGRLLLESADPANRLRAALAEFLRGEVRAGFTARKAAFEDAARALDASDVWRRLPESDRRSIADGAGLKAPAKPEVSTDEALTDHLERYPAAGVRAEIDAMRARADRTIERAARRLEPEVQTVALERATLRDAAEVEAWSERQKKTLLEAVTDGPVLVN